VELHESEKQIMEKSSIDGGKMKDKIIDWVLLIVVIICVFGLLISWGIGQRNKKANLSWTLTKAEQKYIMEELNARGAGYCELEPIPGGWKCTDAQGKIYVVQR
jgi:hypothetical protein